MCSRGFSPSGPLISYKKARGFCGKRSVGRPGKKRIGTIHFSSSGRMSERAGSERGTEGKWMQCKGTKSQNKLVQKEEREASATKKLQYPSTILVIFAAIFTFPAMIFQPRFLNFRYPSPSPSLCWHSGNVQKAFFFPFPWRVDFLFSSIITHWRRVYLPVNQAGGESFPPLGKRRRLVSKGETSSWKDPFLQNNKNYVAFH